jgi:hypothetical protein
LTAQGWWKGSNPGGLSDKTVAVIRVEDLEGKPIAFFINYPVQSSVLLDSVPLDGKILVSGDLGGATARYVERQYGDTVTALWSTGAAGDQDPLFTGSRHIVDRNGSFRRSDIHDAAYALVELLGERLGEAAVKAGNNTGSYTSDVSLNVISKAILCPGQEIFGNIHEMKPRKTYEYKKTEPADIPFSIMILDNIALVGVQVELVCKTSMEIKEASPFKNTIIMTMVNGAAKYLPDAESYDKITYASMNSMWAKGSAELVRDGIVETLDDYVFRRVY